MAWTSPMTFAANAVLTAAQLNTHLRDNLNETAPAKATAAGQIFVSTGLNAIAARAPASHYVGTSQTTTGTSYTDLDTAGPSVTVTTGSRAMVFFGTRMWNTGTAYTHCSFEVSGATSLPASDAKSVALRLTAGQGDGSAGGRHVGHQMETSLTPGSNTFTLKYRVSAGTGRYDERHLFVMPL